MTVNDMICKMIAQAGGNKHDIAHFLKVYTYARLIGEKELLDVRSSYPTCQRDIFKTRTGTELLDSIFL